MNKDLSLFELLAIVGLVYPKENPTEVLAAARLYIKFNGMDYPNDFYGATQVTEEYIEHDGSDEPPEFLG